MALKILTFLVLLLGCVCAAPAKEDAAAKRSAANEELKQDNSDLNAAASSYTQRYSDWGGNYAGSGYGVTGYGTIGDKYSPYYSGYDTYSGVNPGYNTIGYGDGYNNVGYGGYNTAGYGGYNTYNRGYSNSYGLTGYGGYGGYSGNGGLSSYSGYSNPYYKGSYHLGFGYYNKPHGNIYNSGITPNLVTGFRGYSR